MRSKVLIVSCMTFILALLFTACSNNGGDYVDVNDPKADTKTLEKMVEVVGYVAKTVADTEKVQISGQPSGDIVWPVLYWAVNYSFSSQYQKQDGAIVVPAADVEKLYAACFAEGKLPDLENKKYIGCGDIQKQDKNFMFYVSDIGDISTLFDINRYKVLENGDYVLDGILKRGLPKEEKITYTGQIVMRANQDKDAMFPYSMVSVNLHS